MEKTVFKGGAMLSPVPPVMVSVGDMKEHNVFTVGWTGIMCTNPPVTYISVRPERYSYHFIEKTGEFVLNLVPESLVNICDFVGVRTGKNLNKFEKCGLTPINGSCVNTPLILECPVNIECRVREKIHFGTHDCFISDILCVNVNNDLIDKNGKIRLWKANLTAYSHGSYYSIGKHLGDFGFSVRKRKKHKK